VVWKSEAQARVCREDRAIIEELESGAEFPNGPEKNKTAFQPSLEGRL